MVDEFNEARRIAAALHDAVARMPEEAVNRIRLTDHAERVHTTSMGVAAQEINQVADAARCEANEVVALRRALQEQSLESQRH